MADRILVVGAGGLGHPALVALAEAGAADVAVMDPDRVELSNLHRQFLFTPADVGRSKAEAVVRHLSDLYPRRAWAARSEAFRPEASAALRGFDVVLDATDHFGTKLALHDACRSAGIDYVFASAVGWTGQVMAVRDGGGPCLRCAFFEAVPAAVHPTCDVAGVIGPLLGRVAARQVALALTEDPPPTLHLFDGRADAWLELEVGRRPGCRGCLRDSPAPSPAGESDGAAERVDLRGARCPGTWTETRRRLERLPIGGRLWVLFDSDESARQVPLGAEAAGHRVLARRREGPDHHVLLERGA